MLQWGRRLDFLFTAPYSLKKREKQFFPYTTAGSLDLSSFMATNSDADAFSSGHLSVNGIDLYCEVEGSGPPLVLIEGLGVGTWLWEEQVPAFREHFTTIVYDNRGSGRSDKPEGPYTVSEMTDDLVGVLDQLGIDRAHVLGVSLGGFIAQSLAIQAPDRIDRLVLVSATEGGDDHVPMDEETLTKMMSLDRRTREGVRERLRLAFTDAFLEGEPAKVDHLIDLRLADPQPDHAYQAQAAAGASCDLSDEVSMIEAPCLVTAATEDVLVPVENARRLADKIPNSRLELYEGYGHQFFVEIPDRFNDDVITFLSDA